MTLKKITARAHTNIALVKYWGKVDSKLILPQNSSLSLTLDTFYTDTTVNFDPNLTTDHFILNNQKKSDSKISKFIDLVRQKAGITYFANVNSTNHVPTAAGLASSASAFAALAAAASKAAGLKLDKTKLSRLARHGSGSACRSIFGGFVEWDKGHDDLSSFAHPVQNAQLKDIAMVAIVLKTTPKKISSREGMERSVRTSPYYDAWKIATAEDLSTVRSAIQNNDFTTVGKTAERNAMLMHSLTMSANPNYLYLNGDSIKVMEMVNKLRDNGIECYYTMDAGPNVKIICQNLNCNKIKAQLQKVFPNAEVIIAHSGSGIEYLN